MWSFRYSLIAPMVLAIQEHRHIMGTLHANRPDAVRMQPLFTYSD
jgi:hypothetical protein